jgi:hypothetical protein
MRYGKPRARTHASDDSATPLFPDCCGVNPPDDDAPPPDAFGREPRPIADIMREVLKRIDQRAERHSRGQIRGAR